MYLRKGPLRFFILGLPGSARCFSKNVSRHFRHAYQTGPCLSACSIFRIKYLDNLRMMMMVGIRQFSSPTPAGTGGSPGPGKKSGVGGDDDGGGGKDYPLVLTVKDGLQTKESAEEFLEQLSEHQKQLIYHTLNIQILRDKYEDRMGSHIYLSRFGRPCKTKEPDPTGTLCEVPEKWLHERLDEKDLPVPTSAMLAVGFKNSLPFVGFGFLDNLIMILAGDYIDLTVGTALGISTMAAAALGNTISDVAGIGSAWYIESLADKLGIKDPDLTPRQMDSSPIRWATNFGRAFGVAVGCTLGMVPLLFLPDGDEAKEQAKGHEKKEKKV